LPQQTSGYHECASAGMAGEHRRYNNCYRHRGTLIRGSLLLLERKLIEILLN
jgi:hypothetical protein